MFAKYGVENTGYRRVFWAVSLWVLTEVLVVEGK